MMKNIDEKKEILNFDDISNERVKILIREIQSKGEKILDIYKYFNEVDDSGYSLIQLYKLTEQNLKYKDKEYRFYTIMRKKDIFNWENHSNIINLSKIILEKKYLNLYLKYIRFKDNKIFSQLNPHIKKEDLDLSINKLNALLNNSFALMPPIYENKYTDDFVSSGFFPNTLSEEEFKEKIKKINYKFNGYLIENYMNNNIAYWIKNLINHEKKVEAFKLYENCENEISKQYKENIECLNFFIRSFKFLNKVIIKEEFNKLSEYILNEDEFGAYLKELRNKLIRYKNYLNILKQIENLDTTTLELLKFVTDTTNSMDDGEDLLKFIEKYYYYVLIDKIENNIPNIEDYKLIEEYYNILAKSISFTNEIINEENSVRQYIDNLFQLDCINLEMKSKSLVSFEGEIISLIKSWGYKVIKNYIYNGCVIKYIVTTKENINNFVPLYFDNTYYKDDAFFKNILFLKCNDIDILFIWSRNWWLKRNTELIRIRSFLNRIL